MRLDKLVNSKWFQKHKTAILEIPGARSLGYFVYYLLSDAMIVWYKGKSLWLIKLPRGLKVLTSDISDAVSHIAVIWRKGIYDHYQLQKGQIVLDAGAHIGIYTIKASRQVGKTGTVIAIEPHPANFELLKKNLELNKCTNVIPVKAALAASTREVNLSLDTSSAGHSVTLKRSNKSIAVRAITLDDLVKEYKLNALHLIKVNIEGAVIELLKGAEKTLQDYKPRIVTTINHYPTEKEEAINWLSNRGFTSSVWNDILYAESEDGSPNSKTADKQGMRK